MKGAPLLALCALLAVETGAFAPASPNPLAPRPSAAGLGRVGARSGPMALSAKSFDAEHCEPRGRAGVGAKARRQALAALAGALLSAKGVLAKEEEKGGKKGGSSAASSSSSSGGSSGGTTASAGGGKEGGGMADCDTPKPKPDSPEVCEADY